MDEIVEGVASLIFPTKDLAKSKEVWRKVLGKDPYFDQDFYVGYSVGEQEIGLNPGADFDNGAVSFIKVANIGIAVKHFLDHGFTLFSAIEDVGGGIKVAELKTPEGHSLGLLAEREST